MREIVMLKWCDGCQLEGALRTEATHTFTVGCVAGEQRPGLKVLELCDIHHKVIADLQQLLAEVGQTPELPPKPKPAESSTASYYATSRNSEPVQCPVCAKDMIRGSLIGHVWSHHRKDKRPPAPTVCPDCGERYPSPAGCGVHRRQVHDFDALADVLSGVKGYHS